MDGPGHNLYDIPRGIPKENTPSIWSPFSKGDIQPTKTNYSRPVAEWTEEPVKLNRRGLKDIQEK